MRIVVEFLTAGLFCSELIFVTNYAARNGRCWIHVRGGILTSFSTWAKWAFSGRVTRGQRHVAKEPLNCGPKRQSVSETIPQTKCFPRLRFGLCRDARWRCPSSCLAN